MILIEKEPIMKFIEDGLNNKHYGHVGVEIITEVEFAPVIDANPVAHARWKMTDSPYCSRCNRIAVMKYKFCPNCGARMDGEAE